jgi:hypothetical protein
MRGQCARGNGEELFVAQLREWDVATINHLCVEISVLVFFPLNPQTGEFGFRNDCCDGGRMIAIGRGRALDVSGLAKGRPKKGRPLVVQYAWLGEINVPPDCGK